MPLALFCFRYLFTFFLTTYYSFLIVQLLTFGGDKRSRTADLCLARAALSHLSYIPKTFFDMVGMTGLEPVTPALSAQCSNHLSYTPISFYSIVFFSLIIPNKGTIKIKEEDYKLAKLFLLRKEVIHPHLPVRIPCYDFTPITNHTLGTSLQ